MEKLEGKYTIDQAFGLSIFMKNDIGSRYGMYNDKPTILIGVDKDVDGLKPFDEFNADSFFEIYVDKVDPSLKKLSSVLSYIYENKPLELYSRIIIGSRKYISDEDRLLSEVYAIFENKDGKDFVMYCVPRQKELEGPILRRVANQ